MPRQRRLMNQINVVPYIDVMLVLLVIFMVTAPMIQTGNVNVPSTGAGTPTPGSANVITLEIKGPDDFLLRTNVSGNGQTMSRKALIAATREAILKNPEQPIVIAADRDLKYEEVMSMLSELRQAGAKKISLQTQITGGGR